MTGRTLAFFESEMFTLDPDPEVFVPVCVGTPSYPDRPLPVWHGDCDPMTCIEAAMEIMREATDPGCYVCGYADCGC